MNRPVIVLLLLRRGWGICLILVAMLALAACQRALENTGEENVTAEAQPTTDEVSDDADAGEAPIVQIRLGEWRADLPANTSLVIPDGRLINNGFPAVSADRSEIAILYFAGHPLDTGYPTFEIHSTATLALKERIELFSEQEQRQVVQATGQAPNLRDQQLVMRIEGLLDDINENLSQGGFRSIPQWYESQEHQYLDSIERFDRRLAFSWNPDTEETSVTVQSLNTSQVELALVMPRIQVSTYPDDPDDPYRNCRVSSILRQAWYVPDLRILILRMSLSSGIDSCALPDQWILQRLL